MYFSKYFIRTLTFMKKVMFSNFKIIIQWLICSLTFFGVSCSSSPKSINNKKPTLSEINSSQQQNDTSPKEEGETVIHSPVQISSENNETFISVCDKSEEVQKFIMVATNEKDCSQFTAQNLNSIQEIDLSNKHISELKANDFQYLMSLRKLNLSNNQIQNLPETIFHPLTSLEELDLNQNQIRFLD